MTLRRLWVLLKALPADSPFMEAMRVEHEKSLKATPDKIRERQEHYRRKAEQQLKEG